MSCSGASTDYVTHRPMLPPLGTAHPGQNIRNVAGPRPTFPPLITRGQPIDHPIHNNQIRVTDPRFTDAEKEKLVQRMQAVHNFFYDKFGIEAVTREQLFPQIQWLEEGNAKWAGKSGWYFNNRWITVETVAHEYIHAVVQRITKLSDGIEQNALHESLADAFASIFKQYEKKQNVHQADWQMTTEDGNSYRSLKTLPGAYSKIDMEGDPHEVAAIASYPFYYAATKIGGNSWETVSKIWCEAMKNTKSNHGFIMFFCHTVNVTAELYPQHMSVMREAWRQVGIALNI